jgi:hypothetical protein
LQFKVPQNVQIEDKILPFMTLRQLVICGIGGGITYMVYLSLQFQTPEVWIPPVAILGSITLAVSFLQIHGIPFVQYVLLWLESYLNAKKRVWIKSAGDLQFPSTDTTAKQKPKPKQNLKQKLTIKDVEKLSHMLDEGRL